MGRAENMLIHGKAIIQWIAIAQDDPGVGHHGGKQADTQKIVRQFVNHPLGPARIEPQLINIGPACCSVTLPVKLSRMSSWKGLPGFLFDGIYKQAGVFYFARAVGQWMAGKDLFHQAGA